MTCQWHKLLPYSTWLRNPQYQTSLACKRFCSDPNPADLMWRGIKGTIRKLDELRSYADQQGCTRQRKILSHLSQVGQNTWLSQIRASPSTWLPARPDGRTVVRYAAACQSGSPNGELSDHTWGLQRSQGFAIRQSDYLKFSPRLSINVLTNVWTINEIPSKHLWPSFSVCENWQTCFDLFIAIQNQNNNTCTEGLYL